MTLLTGKASSVRPLNYKDLLYVARRMRAIDRREVYALRWRSDPAEFAQDIVGSCILGGIVLGKAGKPASALGGLEMWPGVWQVWMIATDNWQDVKWTTTRYAQRILSHLVLANSHRAECHSSEEHKEAHRWLEYLGAQREGVLCRYGRKKENFYTYAWDVQAFRKNIRSRYKLS